jgi:hypothetical protein
MNIKVGLSKELLELVVLGFELSKLGSVGGSIPPKRERHL